MVSQAVASVRLGSPETRTAHNTEIRDLPIGGCGHFLWIGKNSVRIDFDFGTDFSVYLCSIYFRIHDLKKETN